MPDLAVSLRRGARLSAGVETRPRLRPVGMEPIEGSALYETLHHAPIHALADRLLLVPAK